VRASREVSAGRILPGNTAMCFDARLETPAPPGVLSMAV
jgi:hypothetical protein